MSCTEFAIEVLDDFGFDQRQVLTRLILGIEVAVAFDPRTHDYADAGDFDERAARLRGQENAFYRHCDAPRRWFNKARPAEERDISAPAPVRCSLTM